MEVEVFVQWEKRFWTPCLSPPRPPPPLRPPPTATSPTSHQLVHGTRQVFHTAILTKSYGNVILILSSLSSGTSSISGSSCSSARSPSVYITWIFIRITFIIRLWWYEYVWLIHPSGTTWMRIIVVWKAWASRFVMRFILLRSASSLLSSGHLFSAFLILMYVETDHDWVLALGLDGSLRDPGLDGSLCDLGLDGSLRDPGLDGSLRNPDLLLIHVDVLLNDQT